MKLRTIGYWISTLLITGMMSMSAFFCLTRKPDALAGVKHLGYPGYFVTILGTAYALGVLALLAPKLGRLKEWAYAGFTFAFISAFWSHIAMREHKQSLGAVVALVVLAVSYQTRPDSRRIGAPSKSKDKPRDKSKD